MSSVEERDAVSGSESPEPTGAQSSVLRTDSAPFSDASEQPVTANADIELSRRAVPVIEGDDDVCSVCLDTFTHDDPGNRTGCG